MKLNINFNVNKLINRKADQINMFGDIKEGLKNSDIYSNVLKVNKKDINKALGVIVAEFAVSKNIEILSLATTGAGFKNFVRKLKEKPAHRYGPVAITNKENGISLYGHFIFAKTQRGGEDFKCVFEVYNISKSNVSKKKHKYGVLTSNLILITDSSKFLNYSDVGVDESLAMNLSKNQLKSGFTTFDDQNIGTSMRDEIKLNNFRSTIKNLLDTLDKKETSQMFYVPNDIDIDLKSNSSKGAMLVNKKHNFEFGDHNKKMYLKNNDDQSVPVNAKKIRQNSKTITERVREHIIVCDELKMKLKREMDSYSTSISKHKDSYSKEKTKFYELRKEFETMTHNNNLITKKINLIDQRMNNNESIIKVISSVPREFKNMNQILSLYKDLKLKKSKLISVNSKDKKLDKVQKDIKKIDNELIIIEKLLSKLEKNGFSTRVEFKEFLSNTNDILNKLKLQREDEISKIRDIKSVENKINKQSSKLNDLQSHIEEDNIRRDKISESCKKNDETTAELNKYLKDLQGYKEIGVLLTLTRKAIDENKNFDVAYSRSVEDIVESGAPHNLNKLSILSDFDIGLVKILQRMLSAIGALNNGVYKNPYLLYDLNHPREIDEIKKHKLPSSLNKKQVDVINKALSSDGITYIQGPPGTGKTEVISNIAINIAKDKGPVILTSSTREAILNFMERVDRLTKDDPNIVMLNYNHLNSENNFDEKTIGERFFKKLTNMGKNNTPNEVKEYLSEHKFYVSKAFISKFVRWSPEHIIDKFNFIKSVNSYLNIKFDSNIDLDDEYEIEDQVMLFSNRIKRQKFPKVEALESYFETLNAESNVPLITSQVCGTSKLESAMDLIMDKYVTSSEKTQVAKKLAVNKKINIFGITTTSRKTIEVFNEKYNLISDIQVDTVILDEVSKSHTPEILSSCYVSKRTVLSGDYRQLPPSFDIEKTLLKETYCDVNSLSIDDIDDKDPEFVKWTKDIEELFSNSIFTTHVNNLRNSKSENVSYDFLNQQYRFIDQLNKPVNFLYERIPGEKLITGRGDSDDFIGLKIENEDNSNAQFPFTLVDVQSVPNCVKDLDIDFATPGENSFDHNNDFNKKNNFTYNSKINISNAAVTINIVKQIIESNKYAISDIGVICITKSQATYVKRFISSIKTLSNLKVDTVDNFQGSEKKVIIVDFVRAPGEMSVAGEVVFKGKRNLDFYKKDERLNVAISRARDQLILIGDFDHYAEVNNLYKMYKDYAKKTGGYLKW